MKLQVTTYVINVTETGMLLRYTVIVPVILCASDTVRQYRNVDVLVVERVTTGFEH